MSLGIGHFMIGATLTAVALWMVRPGLPYTRSATLFGGAWAMIPDAGKIERFATPEMLAFHDSPAANVFWGHRYLDVVDAGDSAGFAAAATAAFLLVSVLTEVAAARRDRRPVDVTTAAGSPTRAVVWLRRAVAAAAMATGGVLGLLPFVADGRFTGILVGTGAVLGLLGIEILDEDRALVSLARRVVPTPVRVAARVAVSVPAGSIAAVLLSRVPPMTDLSVPYGALGLVLLVLLLRLWLPTRAVSDGDTGPVSSDRTW
jgi:hypothetical protein